MTTPETPTVDQLAALAERLSVTDKARLMDKIAAQIGTPLLNVMPTAKDNDAWAKMNQLRDELASLYPQADYGNRLEADRAEREATMSGGRDVHP
ncbi:MAG: hypothetical protein MUD01_15730 [Chloroflexaceae bacterium]|jgi:hypothetical protein|nr:hypothetical protein [Chloroflexaceae bacterium]